MYIVVAANTKWSLRFVVWFGIVKLLTLVLYVLNIQSKLMIYDQKC